MDAPGQGRFCMQRMPGSGFIPASITKVMTGLLALEALDAGQMLTVSQEAVNQGAQNLLHISLQPGRS